MRDLARFIGQINVSAKGHSMEQFQEIRKALGKVKRTPTHNIFPTKPNHKDYVYHRGGRTELQFNIGDEGTKWRYGIAFELHKDINLSNPMVLKTRVQKLNEYLENHQGEFKDMRFWYWDEKNEKGIRPKKVEPISEELIRNDMFLFWGKLAPKNLVEPQDVISLFDRLLPVYEYVEGNVINKKQAKGLQFKLGNIHLEHTLARSRRETREINLRHNTLVKALYSILKQKKRHAGNSDTGLLPQIDMVERENDDLIY